MKVLFPKTVSNSALPLFIEENRRVSEGRQRTCSLYAEREPIRDRTPGSIPEAGREFFTIENGELKMKKKCKSYVAGI